METLQQFKNYLLSNAEKPSKVTIKNYLADVRKFIRWFEERFSKGFQPGLVNSDVLQAYKADLNQPTQAQNSISAARSLKRYLSSLRKYFYYLASEQIITSNPFESMNQESKKEADPWHLKEFKNYLFVSRASDLTIKNYLLDIRQFLTWISTVYKTDISSEAEVLPRITTSAIEEYKARLLHQANFSPLSINRKLSSLRKYLTWLEEQELFPKAFPVSDELILARLPAQNETVEAIQPAIQGSISLLKDIDHATINQEKKAESGYSSFPPFRLIQKSTRLLNLAFDSVILASIAGIIEYSKYSFWKLNGREIFVPIESLLKAQAPLKPNVTVQEKAAPLTSNSDNLSAKTQSLLDRITEIQAQKKIGKIYNIPKSVYAPIDISTKHLPWHKRLIYHIRYVRPAWYKNYHSYPAVHYLHFAILMIFVTSTGFGIYSSFIESPHSQKPLYAAPANSPPRVLSFQGRLADSTNTPITAETPLRFGIYNSATATGSALLWQEVHTVVPKADGSFAVRLGQKKPLSQNFFTDNSQLYIGVTVKTDAELEPRQQVANVSYSANSDTLQGLSPITQPDAGTKNVILALDSSGNLTIGGSASPVFQATGGEFTLSGQTLTLATNIGSNTNIQIKPDGLGIIDLQKPLQNTSNYNNLLEAAGSVEVDDTFAILATSSAQSAFLINQNSTGALISASTSGVAKFTVSNSGTGMFAADLAINGNNLTTTSTTFNLLNTNLINLNIGQSAVGISIGSNVGNTTINHSFTTRGLATFNAGAVIPKDQTFKLLGTVDSDLVPASNSAYSLGTATNAWQNAYISKLLMLDGELSAKGLVTAQSGIKFTMQTSSPTTIGVCKSTTDGTGEGTELRECNGTPGDIAEYYAADTDLYPGEVVAISEFNGKSVVTKAILPYQQNAMSVVSTYPVGQFGKPLSSGTIPTDEFPTAIGLAGKVPVKVTDQNGAIKPGDPLTTSDIPGVAMKATKSGRVIGYALERYDGIQKISDGVKKQETLRSQSTVRFNNDPKVPQEAGVGKILVFLNPSWHMAEADLDENGDLAISHDPSSGFHVQNSEGESLTEKAGFAQAIIATIQAGYVHAQTLTTNSLTVTSDNISIGGQSLRGYITQLIKEVISNLQNDLLAPKIVSPVAQINTLHTNLVSPVASDSAISLDLKDSKLTIKNSQEASGSAVAVIDNQGNASFDGDLEARQASFSGTLRARRIIADEIQGLNIQAATVSATYITNVTNIYNSTPSATPSISPNQSASTSATTISPAPLTSPNSLTASPSGQLSYSPTLTADFAQFNQGLVALGGSSFTDASVINDLHIGGSMKISGNSINTIGTDLNLQPLRQANLSIMGGLITIDTDGNLDVKGNAHFAKDVAIKGRLAANIITPLGSGDVNIELGGQKKDASFIIKTASGSGVLSINQLGDLIASGTGKFVNIAANALHIIRGAQADTSLTETVAEGSAGSAVITANETERTIFTPHVSSDSLIYITATSDTQGVTPYIARQTAEDNTINTKGSFTIQLSSPVTQDIKVNWWIVN